MFPHAPLFPLGISLPLFINQTLTLSRGLLYWHFTGENSGKVESTIFKCLQQLKELNIKTHTDHSNDQAF